MKVLHLTGEREDTGGVLSVLRNLQEAGRDTGWRHAVWVNRCFVEKRTPLLDFRRNRFSLPESEHHWKLVFQAALSWWGLKRLLRNEPFDILHAHTRGTLLLALAVASRLGRRVVFTNHNYARNTGLYRWAAQRPNLFTVLVTPNMSKHYGIASQPPRISVISDCCADRLFREPLVRADDRDVPGRAVRFIGVGTIQPYKKWHLIVEALRVLTPEERERVEVSLWGPTLSASIAQRYDRELRRDVARYGLERQILFRGSTNAIGDCLRTSDWFVLPSTNEPCSVALSEALALGLPALVSASGGNVDILHEGKSGLFFQPENAMDLAEKLRLILRGKAVVASPEEIRDTVRGRAATPVARQYEKLYRSVLSEHVEG